MYEVGGRKRESEEGVGGLTRTFCGPKLVAQGVGEVKEGEREADKCDRFWQGWKTKTNSEEWGADREGGRREAAIGDRLVKRVCPYIHR